MLYVPYLTNRHASTLDPFTKFQEGQKCEVRPFRMRQIGGFASLRVTCSLHLYADGGQNRFQLQSLHSSGFGREAALADLLRVALS